MMKVKQLFALLLTMLPFNGIMAQQTQLTTEQLKSLYTNTQKNRISVHDPSVVYEPTSKRHYIFGTMRGTAYTTDFQNWTGVTLKWKTTLANTFVTPATTVVKKGGVEVDFPQFNAYAWSGAVAGDNGETWGLEGNMWAPDVIWNPVMNKWCQYLSINGFKWNSSIVLLTSDNIDGPYEYQGPVIITGFNVNGNTNVDYKKTDLELVIDTRSSLPERYNTYWGRRWPHAIDPCVFYDEEGKLWMSYGSWSGGIWMLELDKETGLRSYDVTYPSTNGNSDGVTSDPYFGKKIAGGFYASGEGSYIEYINGYYYLFISNGGLAAGGKEDDINYGGYQMRVFRSSNPDGPYTDANNQPAILNDYEMNFGANSNTLGVNIFGAYSEWGFVAKGDDGERSQGHNSIIAAKDGRTYLVYHTRFQNRDEGHQVRVHQVFQNRLKWLVAAPFEYNGESTLSEDVATKQLVSTANIPGTYQLLVHKYKLNHLKKEYVTPVEITLTADGKVSGAYSGTWSLTEGTSYIMITLGSTTYNGVLIEQQMDGKSIRAVCFTAANLGGVTIWGYKMRPDYAIAWQVNNQSNPITNNQDVTRGYDLYGVGLGDPNVTLSWTSSAPALLSAEGKYNPTSLTEAADVTLTERMEAGQYFWQEEYNVKVQPESASDDWKTGLLAHYGFDDEQLANTFNAAEKAELKRGGSTSLPALVDDSYQLRNGKVVQLSFGAKDKESYVEIPNPLYGKDLSNGASLSFWLQRADDNLWDALYGFYNPTTEARLFLTGNLYTGYNDNAGTWLDINKPDATKSDVLSGNRWKHVTVVFNPSTLGIRVYVNGMNKSGNNDVYNGIINGTSISSRSGFTAAGYKSILAHIAQCEKLYLGKGSFWGSAPVCFDDVMIHNRALGVTEIMAIYNVCNRVHDFSADVESVGIAEVKQQSSSMHTFDLSGRRMPNSTALKPGIYVRNGKKIFIK